MKVYTNRLFHVSYRARVARFGIVSTQTCHGYIKASSIEEARKLARKKFSNIIDIKPCQFSSTK